MPAWSTGEAADVSDQREMGREINVSAHIKSRGRWAFLWRYVVHSKKKIRFTKHLLDLHWRSRAPELVDHEDVDVNLR